MSKPRRHPERPESSKDSESSRLMVFGMNVLVKIREEPEGTGVSCPKGCNMVYGQVMASGDGYDTDANEFRPMPAPGSVVVFEEGAESVEGHFFYAGGEEYRIVHIDAVIVAFPP